MLFSNKQKYNITKTCLIIHLRHLAVHERLSTDHQFFIRVFHCFCVQRSFPFTLLFSFAPRYETSVTSGVLSLLSWANIVKSPRNDSKHGENIPVCNVPLSTELQQRISLLSCTFPQYGPVQLKVSLWRISHIHKGSFPLYHLIMIISSEEVYVLFAVKFLCFSPHQNRFSSKIAISSLWKFMSMVAAICRGERTEKTGIKRLDQLK